MSTIADGLERAASGIRAEATTWQAAAMKGNRAPAITEAQRRRADAEQDIETATYDLHTFFERVHLYPMTDEERAGYEKEIEELYETIAAATRERDRYDTVLRLLAA